MSPRRTSGSSPTPPLIEEARPARYLLDEATRAPELWHQKAYLARVVDDRPETASATRAILPLAHVLDAGGPDAIAMTVEADGAGGDLPGRLPAPQGPDGGARAHPHPLLEFTTRDHRTKLAEVIGKVIPSYAAPG